MIPVVICTLGSPSLEVLLVSLRTYSPQSTVIVTRGEPSTFGQAYNGAMTSAFKLYDEIVISNDDAVITPDTIQLLLEDVATLKARGEKLGFVATLADNARDSQHIRFNRPELRQAERVSPIFAWISKEAFAAAQFPPLNWYSDDVMCEDLNALGFKHFISRAYVHHAGSQTVGVDYRKLNDDALPWLRANRPQYVKKWFNL